MDNLSANAKQVLDTLTELGSGSVAEIRAKTGKAKSTTDKAIRELADAALVVETDPGDGNPPRWSVTAAASEPINADAVTVPLPHSGTGVDTDVDTDAAQDEAAHLGGGQPADNDTDNPGTGDPGQPNGAKDPIGDSADDRSDHDTDRVTDRGIGQDSGQPADESTTETGPEPGPEPVRPRPPADRKVLAVRGVLGDYPDGATINEIADASGFNVGVVARLLQAMAQADAARRIPGDAEAGTPERWQPGPGKASEVDPNPAPPRCPWCQQVIRGATSASSNSAISNSAMLQTLAWPDGTLHVVGPDGADHVIQLPKHAPARTPGVTSSTGIASTGRAGTGTVNADGNEPLGRNVLRGWALEFINAHPGHVLSPATIADALGAQHGRTISPGAVLNNCRTLVMTGQIQLVSESPFAVTAAKTGDNDQQP